MDDFKGKRVTVAGLGNFGGGIAAARWLAEQGARVLVTDRSTEDQLRDSIRCLEGASVELRLGGHELRDFIDADIVVTSPAIPPGNGFIAAARDAGVAVTTEIALFIERCRAPIVGVTGTKGKSTTTALLGRMLEMRHVTHVGGNIGGSLLADLPRIEKNHVVVLELSSFMLEYLRAAKWSPHVALVTALAVDHVDWHGSADAYLDAKRQIVRDQSPNDFAVLGRGVWEIDSFARASRAGVIWFDGRPADERRFSLRLTGEHNQFNAQAAFAAARVFGISFDEAQKAVGDFTALPHRLELVHEENGVRYYNDSIATIPQAAIAALDSFEPRCVIQIVGGHDKHLALDAMCAALADRAKAVLCIGATGRTIAGMVRACTHSRALVEECGQLASAVARARQIAQRGDVVMLSTGCASYDQFTNFQHRGEQFAQLVRGESPVDAM